MDTIVSFTGKNTIKIQASSSYKIAEVKRAFNRAMNENYTVTLTYEGLRWYLDVILDLEEQLAECRKNTKAPKNRKYVYKELS